jgi:hypothetical protein
LSIAAAVSRADNIAPRQTSLAARIMGYLPRLDGHGLVQFLAMTRKGRASFANANFPRKAGIGAA